MVFGINDHWWYFKIVSNFTRLKAREITYNYFEISLVVFMPNITTNHTITYTNRTLSCISVAIPVDLIILHWYACGADGLSGGRSVGVQSRDYQIFSDG